MAQRIIFRWPLLCLALLGCTWSTDDEFFKEVPEFDGSAFVSLDQYNTTDTIYLYGYTEFQFQVAIEDATIKEARVLLDDKEIFRTPAAGGKFSINPRSPVIEGEHDLTIAFISATHTGSLASKLEAEFMSVWRTWKVKVDLAPPPKPEIFLSSENGYLKVSWTPYTRPNFLYYSIYSTVCGQSDQIYIDDPFQSFVINKRYAGGCNIQYEVQTVTKSGNSDNFVAQQDRLTLTGEYRLADSTMFLSWDKADYSAAFMRYVITEGGEETHTIVNATDSSLRFRPRDVMYGLGVWFSVRMYAEGGASAISNFLIQESLVETEHLSPVQDYLVYNATGDFIVGFVRSSGTATMFDRTMQLQSSVNVGSSGVTIPGGGNHVYYPDAEKGVVQFNLLTGERDYIDVVKMTTGGIFNGLSIFSASSNQIVTFRYRAHNSTGAYLVYHYCVYDMVNDLVLIETESQSAFESPVVSVDGRYLKLLGDNVYQIAGTTVTPLFQLPSGRSFLFFKPDNTDEVVTSGYDVVYVNDSQTGSLKRSITFPSDFIYRGYDPLTKNLLYTRNLSKFCWAINIETQEQRQINVYTKNASNFYMINGYMFDKETENYFKAINE